MTMNVAKVCTVLDTLPTSYIGRKDYCYHIISYLKRWFKGKNQDKGWLLSNRNQIENKNAWGLSEGFLSIISSFVLVKTKKYSKNV